jgi:hypothetical protein
MYDSAAVQICVCMHGPNSRSLADVMSATKSVVATPLNTQPSLKAKHINASGACPEFNASPHLDALYVTTLTDNNIFCRALAFPEDRVYECSYRVIAVSRGRAVR